MPDREKSDRSETAPLLSGELGSALVSHTVERINHFFMYVFYAKALQYCFKKDAKENIGNILKTSATHQIDEGVREVRDDYISFNRYDPDVVFKSVTLFDRLDAAHFCNLGVTNSAKVKLEKYNGSSHRIKELWERLKVVMGNTRQLPQLINIGPDRIVDQFHGRYANTLIKSNKKLLREEVMKTYCDKMKVNMDKYISKKN